MSNSNRIIGAAIGLTIWLCPIFSIAEQVNPNQLKGGDNAQGALVEDAPIAKTECGQETAKGSQRTGNFDGAAFTLNCGGNAIASEKDKKDAEQRERDDLVAQQSVAESTKFIVQYTLLQMFLSGFGLLALLYSLRQTNRAVRAAEKQSSDFESSSRLEMRPYISVVAIRLWSDTTDNEATGIPYRDPRKPIVSIGITNIGKSIAQNVITYFDMEMIPFPFPNNFKFPVIDRTNQPEIFLFPGVLGDMPVRREKSKAMFDEHQIEQMIKPESHRLCAFGRVEYRGVGLEKYQTPFAFTVSGGEGVRYALHGKDMPNGETVRFEYVTTQEAPT
jgi:hypothetical protein